MLTRGFISWLVGLGLLLALTRPAKADAPVEVQPYVEKSEPGTFPALSSDHSGYARAGAVVGLSSAVLLLAGGVALTLVDNREPQQITRGTLLVLAGVAVPTSAILALVTRRRAMAEGYAGLRTWGWAAWTGGMVNLGLQWALVLDDRPVSPLLTLAGCTMGALGATLHGFEAFASARRAKLRFQYHLGPMGLGASLRF